MKNKLSQILDIAYKMSSLKRYSQTHLLKAESVLEHTGFVSLLAYYISIELMQEGFEVDLGVVLSRCVVHDIDEIITGDIPTPTKYYNEGVRDAIQLIETANMKNIADCLGHDRIFNDWDNAKEGKEGHIVRLCDKLAIVYKAYYESVMLGNKTICDHAINTYGDLEEIGRASNDHFANSKVLQMNIEEAKMLCVEIQQIKTGE